MRVERKNAKKIRKRFVRGILAAVAACLLFGVFCVFAAGPLFHTEPPEEEIARGASFEVRLVPETDALAAFVLRAEYDPAVVTGAEAVPEDGFAESYSDVKEENGALTLICAAKGGAFAEAGAVRFVFRTGKETEAESADVRIVLEDAADRDARTLTAGERYDVRARFEPMPSRESRLFRLTPSEGTLKPDFSPDVYRYELEVPFAVTSLDFETEAEENVQVKVNRRNLGAGGTTVDFEITVTAEDGETKSTYTVAATRGARVPAPTNTPKPTATPKASKTPKPTVTPKPTQTPKPTAAPKAEGTAAPLAGTAGGTQPPDGPAGAAGGGADAESPGAAGAESGAAGAVYQSQTKRGPSAKKPGFAAALLIGVCGGGGLVLAAGKALEGGKAAFTGSAAGRGSSGEEP